MEYFSKSAKETQKIAADFAKSIVRMASTPIMVGLTGDLGAGKTVFVQGMAKGFGIDPKHYVTSPTFTLINEYEGPSVRLIHVDLYRMEHPLEMETLGLDDYWQPHHVIAVEWVERVPALEKRLDFKVCLENRKDNERIVRVESC